MVLGAETLARKGAIEPQLLLQRSVSTDMRRSLDRPEPSGLHQDHRM